MIKVRIKWCSCRVENILTLGKLLRLWFCFLLHSFFFYISNLLSYIQNNFSYELARPIMGTIFLVYICIYVYRMSKCVGGITWPKHGHAQSQFGPVKTNLWYAYYSFLLYARAALTWMEKKRHQT